MPKSTIKLTELEQRMLEKGFVTAAAAARRIGRRPSAIYTWVRKGTIKSVSIGPQVFVEVASIKAYLGGDTVCEMLGLSDWIVGGM
jgi:hypothetical protein